MKVTVLLIAMFLITVKSKRILGIYGHPVRSHQIIGQAILKNLAKRGHHVTMVSSFPLEEKMENFEDIYLDGLIEYFNNDNQRILKLEQSLIMKLSDVLNSAQYFANKTFNHPAIKRLISTGRKFDLIVMDWLCKDAELFYGYIFNAPIIVTSSFGTLALTNYLINNPEPYSYVPGPGIALTDEMDFFDRIKNTLWMLFIKAALYRNSLEQLKILKSNFENALSTQEMKDNVALIFTNAHPSFESPRPILPNVMPIGGCHIEVKRLPKDLKEYMDNAKNGVVYFTLGSNLKVSSLPKTVIKEILSALSKIPQNVLFKWENDALDFPKNVRPQKWFPQMSILAHPNTKAFITHSGLLSKIEAIYFGIPMIGIPVFGDQETNVAHSVKEGIAIKIKLGDLSEETLLDALNDIINNTSYRNNIRKKSQILKDQPMKPIDTAIYWTEYVMRYNDTNHLKNKSVKLYWFQYLLLDVAVFLISVLVIIFILFTKIYKFILAKIFCRNKDMKKEKKN